MKAVLIALFAVVGLTIVDVGTAQAAGRRRCGSVTYAPVYAAAPAQSGTLAQGQAGTGYRTYSYQPVAPTYRSYQAPKKAPWEYPKTDPRRYGGTNQ
jgi:hypothetical protein